MKTFQKQDFFTQKKSCCFLRAVLEQQSLTLRGEHRRKLKSAALLTAFSLWKGRKQYLVQVSLLLSSPTKACLGFKSCLFPWALLQILLSLLSGHQGQEKKKENQVALYHSAPFYLPASDLLVLLSLNKSLNHSVSSRSH